jgi:hypothetical protein
MLQNNEGAIKNDQSRETGNIGHTRRRKTKQNTTQYVLDTTIRKQTQHNMCWTPLYVNKHNTICVRHHYT